MWRPVLSEPQLAIVLFASLNVLYCGGDSNPLSVSDPTVEPGSWVRWTPYDWSHDGEPYESAGFRVYSDASSIGAKRQLAEIAETRFDEILLEFGFSREELGIVEGSTWLEIYSNKTHSGVRGFAYPRGFIMSAIDSDVDRYFMQDPVAYRVEIKHELMHDLQFLLIGGPVPSTRFPERWPDVWFTEGIAVHIMGPNHHLSAFSSLQEVENWRAQPGHDNPVGIDRVIVDHYPMFGLAVRYLLDPRGHGRSLEDVKQMYADMASGAPFGQAFENHMDMSVDEYGSQFWDLIYAYLSP